MRALILALAAIAASPAAAHDFWVQPVSYWAPPRASVPMTLQVGHGPYRQRSPIPLARIARFSAISPGGSAVDLRSALRPGGGAADGEIALGAAPGAYVVILETDNRAQSHLPAIRFNDYLRVEGLTPALEQRARTGRTGADGSEAYSRRAKVLVQVGAGGSQAQVTKPLGLPLEIVPEVSPYAQPRQALLPVRVLYRGRPLAGALVKLTDLAHDAEPVETHRTDTAGRARFTMPSAGQWLLNVIWTEPLGPTRETDFETVFSSLSFGFPPNPPGRDR